LKKLVSKGFRLARFCRTTVLNNCLKQALYLAQINISRHEEHREPRRTPRTTKKKHIKPSCAFVGFVVKIGCKHAGFIGRIYPPVRLADWKTKIMARGKTEDRRRKTGGRGQKAEVKRSNRWLSQVLPLILPWVAITKEQEQ